MASDLASAQVLEQQLVSLREELGRQELSSGDVARIAQQRATVQKQVDSLRAEIQQVRRPRGAHLAREAAGRGVRCGIGFDSLLVVLTYFHYRCYLYDECN